MKYKVTNKKGEVIGEVDPDMKVYSNHPEFGYKDSGKPDGRMIEEETHISEWAQLKVLNILERVKREKRWDK